MRVKLFGLREYKFLKIMWVVMSALVIVWSVLSGLQLVVTVSIIERNSLIVSSDSKAVGIGSIEDGYIVLSNKEKVKDSDIHEYIKTKTGMLPRYIDGRVTQPLALKDSLMYALKFAVLVLSSYLCLMVCNLLGSVKPRWARNLMRLLYSVMVVGYSLVGIVYSSLFTYIPFSKTGAWFIAAGIVLFVLYDICLFSIRLERKEKGNVN